MFRNAIIFFVIFVIAFIIYLVISKFVSRLLKKAKETEARILNESKTEEERIKALKDFKRKNGLRCIGFYIVYLIGLPLIFVPLMFFIRSIPHMNVKPIGSYELFSENGTSYYGDHDYSIFCYNKGLLAFSSYKIYNNREKTVFETNSYENFISKLKDMFENDKIQKINFYGTCTSDPGYKSLGYALNKSKLIKSHEIENLQDRQLIHIKTVDSTIIEIEYLSDDMICTCQGG
ncbi:MAG: hypothetical protein J6Y16_05170 [Treponema sp.]|nr:hypothetical protein [Treponema sp.]